MIRLSIQLSARTHIHFSCVFNSNSFQLAVPPQLTFLWGGRVFVLLIHMSATEKPLACPRQKEGDCLSLITLL